MSAAAVACSHVAVDLPAIDHLAVAAAHLNTAGVIVRANQSLLDLLGLSAGDLVDCRFDACLGAETDAEDARRVMRALVDRDVFVGELLCYTRLGAPFWSDVTVLPSASTAGDEVQAIMLMRDVTARRTAAAALSVTPTHDRLLLDRLQAGIVVHSATTDVLYANARATELLGVSPDTVLGAVDSDARWCFVREDGSEMPCGEYPVRQALATGTPVRELLLGARRPKDQKLLWLMCNAYPVLDAQGVVTEVVVSFTDVTELK